MAIEGQIGGEAPENNDEQTPAPGMDDVLDQATLDALHNVRVENLITADPQAEAVKGNSKRSGCWIHGIALIELNSAADKRATKVAELAGQPCSKVERAELLLVPGTKLLLIKPAKINNLAAFQVNRYAGGSSAWMNAFNLLGPAGLTIQSGYKVRYDVAYVPKSSPLWPGLLINLGQPLERRLENKKKGETAPPAPPK